MAEDQDTKQKEKLLTVLEDVDRVAAPLQKSAQEIIEATQQSRDMAKVLSDFVRTVPGDKALPSEFWRQQMDAWAAYNDHARTLVGTIAEPLQQYSTVALSTGSTVTTMAAEVVVFGPAFGGAEVHAERARHRLIQGMNIIRRRHPLADEVRAAMVRLSLNRAHHSKKSALALLDDAQAALDRPTTEGNSAVAVLVGLRESIDGAITDLLRRRPMQESTDMAGGKLLSIGQQCAKSGMPFKYFERLEASLQNLNRSFSEGKQRNYSREELILLFDGGLSFLRTLLEGLDESKFKPQSTQ
jgi:hypothetical protein